MPLTYRLAQLGLKHHDQRRISILNFDFQSIWIPSIWSTIHVTTKWASSWDNGTYHIGDQRRLGWACASAPSCQSLRCSHTWSMELDERSDQNQASGPIGWLHNCVWRMSLRRTKSAIISWAGSIVSFIKVSLMAHAIWIASFPLSWRWMITCITLVV